MTEQKTNWGFSPVLSILLPLLASDPRQTGYTQEKFS